jgi:hypothetical protein
VSNAGVKGRWALVDFSTPNKVLWEEQEPMTASDVLRTESGESPRTRKVWNMDSQAEPPLSPP